MKLQPTKNYSQLSNLSNADSTINLYEGRACQLVIQYQMVSPENINKSNIIQTKKVIYK